MKKLMLALVLLMSVISGAMAQNDAMYIYRNDGDFNAFLKADIDSIRYSHLDADSVYHSEWQMQEIFTPDSTYRIPLAAIDSISLTAPETKVKPGVLFFTDDYIPYTQSHTEETVTFLSSLPDEMRPVIGQVVASSTVLAPFDYGFSGRVTNIIEKGDSIVYECESVSISDIYERIVTVGKIYNDAAPEARHKAVRKIGDGLSHTIPIPFPRSLSISAGPVSLDIDTELSCTYVIFVEPGFTPVVSIQLKHVHECVASISVSAEAGFDEAAYGTPVPINTGIPGCYGTFKLGPFFSIKGSAKVSAKLPFTVTGYSGFHMNGLNISPIKTVRSRMGDPDWSIDMEGSIYTGIDARLSFNVVHEKFASAFFRLRLGPKFSTSFSLSGLDLATQGAYAALKDSKMDTCFDLNTTLGYRMVGGKDQEALSADLTFMHKEAYFLPEFSNMSCKVDHENKSITASTNIDRQLVVPVKVGFTLYDQNELKDKWFNDITYWTDLTFAQPLSHTFDNLEKGKTYEVYPIISIWGIQMQADTDESAKINPGIETLNAEQDNTSVTFYGSVDGAKYSEDSKVGIVYGTNKDLNTKNGKFVYSSKNDDGKFSVKIDNLALGKKYYYCAAVISGGETYYGEIKDCTLNFEVTTLEASGITKNSAHLQGELSIAPTDKNTTWGFCLKKSGGTETKYKVSTIGQSGLFGYDATSLTEKTKYLFRAFCNSGNEYFYGDWKSFETKDKDKDDDNDDDDNDDDDDDVDQPDVVFHKCPDNNHPHAIDLGLPSGTKWCCMNVGASSPEQPGGYYAWGETSEKSWYVEMTYSYFTGQDTNGDSWIDENFSVIDIGSDIASTSYDVAHVRMGAPWRMPSHEQQLELISNCTRKWTQQNGVDGMLAIGKNGGQIFLPAVGYRSGDAFCSAGSDGNYWSSSLNLDDSKYAWYLNICQFYWSYGYDGRDYGRAVRAVCP